jgi:hypothetical protein
VTAVPVPPIPATQAVDGAELLGELRAAFTRYVVLPSPQAADAVTLWTAATHAQPAWEHAPRLAVVSPLKRCGKSRLLDVVAETCHAPPHHRQRHHRRRRALHRRRPAHLVGR